MKQVTPKPLARPTRDDESTTSQAAPVWVRSSRCEGGHCVEVAAIDGGVALRNSTVPGVALSLSAGAWQVFLEDIRAGAFEA
jgi:hypothetical protein